MVLNMTEGGCSVVFKRFINSLRWISFMKAEVYREMSLLGSVISYSTVVLLALAFKEFTLFFDLVLGLLICLAVVWPVKYFFFRRRPDNTKYKSIIQKIDASSFPSTHSARSVLILLIIGGFFHSYSVYSILAVLAFLNGFSRVYQKRHFVSDVLGGYAVGAVSFVLLTLLR
jgi:undecaprenyl-diphosphatase